MNIQLHRHLALAALAAGSAHANLQPPPSPAPVLTIALGQTNLGKLALDSHPNATSGRDILVGLPSLDQVRLYASATGQLIATYQHNVLGAEFGFDVASVADTNNNGFPEILVGAPAQGQGHAFLLEYPGTGNQLTLLRTWRLAPALQQAGTPTARYGHRVTRMPDINGDGRGEVAVSAPLFDAVGGSTGPTGRVEVVNVVPGIPVTLGAAVGGDATEEMGSALAEIGDVNGDGVLDLAVGSSRILSTPTPSRAGVMRLFSGASFTGTPLGIVRIGGGFVGDGFGASVAWAGDLNNDAIDDVLVGAPNLDAANLAHSMAYSGASVPGAVVMLHKSSDSAFTRFGHAITSVRNHTGGTHRDILVGAPNLIGSSGVAYLVNGATGAIATFYAHPLATKTFGFDVTSILTFPRSLAIGDPDAGRVFVYA